MGAENGPLQGGPHAVASFGPSGPRRRLKVRRTRKYVYSDTYKSPKSIGEGFEGRKVTKYAQNGNFRLFREISTPLDF